jgi:hypothetical protein
MPKNSPRMLVRDHDSAVRLGSMMLFFFLGFDKFQLGDDATGSCSNSTRVDGFFLRSPSNSPNDHDEGPTVGASCRCLNLSTSMGGTHSKVEGGDRHDLEPEGLREDTRHKIYTGSGSRVATLRPV